MLLQTTFKCLGLLLPPLVKLRRWEYNLRRGDTRTFRALSGFSPRFVRRGQTYHNYIFFKSSPRSWESDYEQELNEVYEVTVRRQQELELAARRRIMIWYGPGAVGKKLEYFRKRRLPTIPEEEAVEMIEKRPRRNHLHQEHQIAIRHHSAERYCGFPLPPKVIRRRAQAARLVAVHRLPSKIGDAVLQATPP